MPAPLHLLGVHRRTAADADATGVASRSTPRLSGLPELLASALTQHPEHALADSPLDARARALSLRGLAQNGDRLAMDVFLFQARALGLHVASLAMALDPGFVVIGGGLMDPEATTPAFRERYLATIRETAAPYLWPTQRSRLTIVPAALGDLSQAIGAALVALYSSRS